MSSILQSIPSPTKIREELEQMVLKNLLGPVGGAEEEEEEIDEPSVRDRYLVGMLAPKRQEPSPEEFDELPQGGKGTSEEGSTDYTAPTTKAMFPSSFGMIFCVGLEAKAIQITARWGYYSRQRSETLSTPTGDKKLIWKRSPRAGVSEPIPLKVGRLNWTPDPEFPEVQVQGLIRQRDSFWTITLFLVNGQEEPKKLRDMAWLFQPKLIVESSDGEPIFDSRPVSRNPGKSDPVTFAEEQEMAMLYRYHVEFGVGHGVSIHAECPEGVCERRKDGSLPGALGLHDGPAALAGDGGRPLGRVRHSCTHAVYAEALDDSAVSAGNSAHLCLRTDPSHRREEMGQRTVPNRPVGRTEDDAEHDRSGF
jgi:hypothetical protein